MQMLEVPKPTYNSSILNNLIIFNYTSTVKCLLIITIIV
jgi:hypothetical protein